MAAASNSGAYAGINRNAPSYFPLMTVRSGVSTVPSTTILNACLSASIMSFIVITLLISSFESNNIPVLSLSISILFIHDDIRNLHPVPMAALHRLLLPVCSSVRKYLKHPSAA